MDGHTRVFGSQLLKERGLFGQHFPLIPPLPPPALAVIDANTVLRAANWKTKRSAPTFLSGVEELHDAGQLLLVAPPRLVSEVERNMADFRRDQAVLRTAAEAVLRRVVLLDTPQAFASPTAARMAARDVTDVEYARLYDFARADWVLSNDDDWDATEAQRFRANGQDEIRHLRDACRAHAQVRGAHLTTALGLAAVRGAFTHPVGLGLLAAFGLFMLLSPRVRSAVTEAAADAACRLRPMLESFLLGLADSQARLRGEPAAVAAELARGLRALTLGDRLFRLALARGGVLIKDVGAALRRLGLLDAAVAPQAVWGATSWDARIVARGGVLRTHSALAQRNAAAAWKQLRTGRNEGSPR